METNERITEQVNKVIQTNMDRREGYEKAIDQIADESLKALFADCSRQSNENINELRQIVIQHGGEPVDTTSTAGDLYRVWMDVKTALAASNTKAVLQSCEQGEDIALKAYREVYEAQNGSA
ncbi:MAG: PA2169 family four-helix-bundle protein, partial [Sphingobacteriales bacterium]